MRVLKLAVLFLVEQQTFGHFLQLCEALQFATSVVAPEQLGFFAFAYRETLMRIVNSGPSQEMEWVRRALCDGWRAYNAEIELARLGLPCSNWRTTYLNEEYRFCESYPEVNSFQPPFFCKVFVMKKRRCIALCNLLNCLSYNSFSLYMK